ncbi:MAG: hypothetical protein QXM89_02505 [Candidatus Bathyarchaeia archaeon]
MFYLLRVCTPVRDWNKISDLLNSIENGQIVKHNIDRLFPNRPDLDAVELIMILDCSPDYVKMLRRELATRLSGTIGFFAVYRIKNVEALNV